MFQIELSFLPKPMYLLHHFSGKYSDTSQTDKTGLKVHRPSSVRLSPPKLSPQNCAAKSLLTCMRKNDPFTDRSRAFFSESSVMVFLVCSEQVCYQARNVFFACKLRLKCVPPLNACIRENEVSVRQTRKSWNISTYVQDGE